MNVVEIDPENGEVIAGGLQGSVVLNADATNPVPADPDLNSFFETHDPIVVSGALSSFANPNFFNPNFFNPNFFNPNFFNPNFFNPNFFNTTLTELEWEVQNSGNGRVDVLVFRAQCIDPRRRGGRSVGRDEAVR